MAIELTINGKAVALDVPGDTPLLWAVRDELELKGTKFCLLYTSPSPRDAHESRMPSSA